MMKIENKNKYVPCTIKVLEFEAERPFASAGFVNSNPNQVTGGTMNMILRNSQGANTIKNEHYQPVWSSAKSDFWAPEN